MLLNLLSKLPPVWLYLAATIGLAAGYLFGPLLARTPLAIGSAIPCIAFLVLGLIAKKMHGRIRQPVIIGGVLLIISAGLIAAGLSHQVNLKIGDYGTPVVSVLVAGAICFGLVLLAEALFARLPRIVHRAATLLAYAGLVAVLVHPAVIWVAAGRVNVWLLFLASLVISWAIGLVLIRTPVSGWLSGVPTVGGADLPRSPIVPPTVRSEVETPRDELV